MQDDRGKIVIEDWGPPPPRRDYTGLVKIAILTGLVLTLAVLLLYRGD